jgi:hypothetical protein
MPAVVFVAAFNSLAALEAYWLRGLAALEAYWLRGLRAGCTDVEQRRHLLACLKAGSSAVNFVLPQARW